MSGREPYSRWVARMLRTSLLVCIAAPAAPRGLGRRHVRARFPPLVIADMMRAVPGFERDRMMLWLTRWKEEAKRPSILVAFLPLAIGIEGFRPKIALTGKFGE